MKPRTIEGPFYFTRHATGELNAKLPELHRAATFEREQIDTENRIVPVVFATEAPVDRWFGREKLICTPEACNISRANNTGAFLSEHQRDKQIGVIVKGSVSFGEDRQARAKLRFSKNSALAEQEWKDLQDGIRGLFSVGYAVKRLVLVEEDEQRGDLYEIRDWEVLEVSLVSIPADPDCVIDGRSETEDKHNVIIQAEPTMLNRSRTTFARFMAPDTGANPPAPTPAGPTPEQQRQLEADRTKAIEDARKQETERIRELGHLGVAYGKQDEAAKYMNEGKAVREFRDWLLDNGFQKVETRSEDPAPGQSPLNPGSGPSKAVTRSIGDYLVESESLKQYREGAGKTRSAAFELPEFNLRATLASSAIPAGSVATTELAMVPAVQTRLTIVDLMRQGTVSTGVIHYLKEILPTNAAAMVAEGGLKPEATFTFEDASTNVRKVAVIARVNDEMLQDYSYIRSYIDEKMVYMIREREEAQVLAGDGNAPNLLGILNTSGLQTQAVGADTGIDAIHRAMTKIRVTGQAEPDGVVLHPNAAQEIYLAKDDNGQYLAGGPFYGAYGQGAYQNARRIWGVPIVETTVITSSTALVGAFRQYSAIYRRSGITIETTNSDGDDFKYNRTAIRVEERIAVIVERPAAFCLVSGLSVGA